MRLIRPSVFEELARTLPGIGPGVNQRKKSGWHVPGPPVAEHGGEIDDAVALDDAKTDGGVGRERKGTVTHGKKAKSEMSVC
jgi:hypothetical protein